MLYLGLAWHATVDGTLNDGAVDHGYHIAVRIPWASLALPPGASATAGLVLGADLALDNLDSTGLAYADWASITPFAQPSHWHQLRLVGGAVCP